jgi:diacylglycerol kinase family enzyme
MTQGRSAPHIIETPNLQLVDGRFTFPGDDQHEPLSLDDVFLLLASTKSPETWTISVLKEDLSNNDNPWKLFFLRVSKDQLPSEVRSQHSSPVDKLPSHLLPGEGNQVDVIVSTKSGTGKALVFWQTVLQPLLKLVYEELDAPSAFATLQEHVLVTETADSVWDFGKTLGQSDKRTVILLSGDGGVVDLLNAVGETVLPSPPTIALLPLGTGNALFHSMHKPAYKQKLALPPLAWGLHTLLQGTNPFLPAFEATFPAGSNIIPPGLDAPPDRPVSSLRGVVVASYGFHASIVYESDTPEHRVHGAKRFGMVAQELLVESHAYDARVSLLHAGAGDPVPLPRDKHAYVLTTLVSNLEQPFTISPASKPLDGKLWTVHFGPLGPERTMEAMKAAYDGGRHVSLSWEDGERIGYDEVEEIDIEIRDEDERWRKVCIDGTIVGVPKGGTVRVRRIPESAFRILISQEALH